MRPLADYVSVKISTHAPAGGATVSTELNELTGYISTHAPAGGATENRAKYAQKYMISTHAPAGGATAHHRLRGRRRPISTHAPAGGATCTIPELIEKYGLFLLTPLREGRRLPACAKTLCPYFYSRPCGRGDKPNPSGNSQYAAISTHAPAGGATLMDAEEIRCAKHFYSRPCGRGD